MQPHTVENAFPRRRLWLLMNVLTIAFGLLNLVLGDWLDAGMFISMAMISTLLIEPPVFGLPNRVRFTAWAVFFVIGLACLIKMCMEMAAQQ